MAVVPDPSTPKGLTSLEVVCYNLVSREQVIIQAKVNTSITRAQAATWDGYWITTVNKQQAYLTRR